MALNSAALQVLSTMLQTNLSYAQLHSGLAGGAGIDNIAVPGRQAVPWGVPVGGVFGLASSIDYDGGTPFGVVYSVTLWDAVTDGNFYGEFALDGDGVFNSVGEYSITVIDVTGTATD